MKTILCGLAALLPAAAPAAVRDIPLAVTSLAHATLRTTPSPAELQQSDRYLDAGLELLRKNQPRRAIREFNDSVNLAPRAENYKALGTAYYQAGDSARSAWAYRQSLQLQPDARVQALVDSLEGRDHPEERFADKNEELRFERLLKSASAKARAGKADSALRDYLEACAILPEARATQPCLELAAQTVEASLAQRALARAVVTLARVEGLKTAPDLGPRGLAALNRLEQAEARVAELTGMKLREHEQAMRSDREAWERKLAEKLAEKPGSLRIQLKGR